MCTFISLGGTIVKMFTVHNKITTFIPDLKNREKYWKNHDKNKQHSKNKFPSFFNIAYTNVRNS